MRYSVGPIAYWSVKRVYRTLSALRVENLRFYVIYGQNPADSLGIALDLEAMFGARLARFELQNHGRPLGRDQEAVNDATQRYALVVTTGEGKRDLIQNLGPATGRPGAGRQDRDLGALT